MSVHISGSSGCVAEEVTDKKMISEVSMGLLNLFLKGNQLGAYGPIYHGGGFHQCPKINSAKT